MPFLGLDVERWKQGFTTQREVFTWVSNSPYFDARRMARSDADQIGRRKAREVRGMYQNFLAYANELAVVSIGSSNNRLTKQEVRDATLQAALDYFGKRKLYGRLLRVAKVKERVKTVFTGKMVIQWTGLQGLAIRWVMDEVRTRMGADGANDEDGSSLADAPAASSEGVQRAAEEEASILPSHLTLAAWEYRLEAMSVDEVQALIMQVKEEMYDNGQLEHNWREAKRAKAKGKSLLDASTAQATAAVTLEVATQ